MKLELLLKYQCSPFALGVLPWDVLNWKNALILRVWCSNIWVWCHLVVVPWADLQGKGFTLGMFPKQVPYERVWRKDEDRPMSSSSLLICSSTALLRNVSMSVKQRDCTLFSKVLWKYLQDMDVILTEYAEMSWHETLAIVASSSWDLKTNTSTEFAVRFSNLEKLFPPLKSNFPLQPSGLYIVLRV